MASAAQQNRLNQVAPAALAASEADEALARVQLAQYVYESGWGAKSIENEQGVNPFGIKAAKGEPSMQVTTTEYLTPDELKQLRARGANVLAVESQPDGIQRVTLVDTFRLWPTVEDAFRGHIAFLKSGYRQAAFSRYLAQRRPPERSADPAAIAKDVRTLAHELQHLSWSPQSGKWLRYSTSPSYEEDIVLMALSRAVSAAIESARGGRV